MPASPGCQPNTARIGFEVHPGEAILFVDKGIRYEGDCRTLHDWLRNGELRFPAPADLRDWLRQELGPLTAPMGPGCRYQRRPHRLSPGNRESSRSGRPN